MERPSLPVVVAIYDPGAERAHWQAVTRETTELTGKGRKITVPRVQVLDDTALSPLAELAAPRSPEEAPEVQALSRLRSDLTWMEVLDAGGTVHLEAQEWINKSSGRGDLVLIAQPPDGQRALSAGSLSSPV